MFARLLDLPEPGSESFFLWGPRQVGKTTWLRTCFPTHRIVNLLEADTFRRYAVAPERLREELLAKYPPEQSRFVIIDEVQKVPALLDEVHNLIETHGFSFALCGSSARKVRRGAANLLGGRALRFELQGLCAKELGHAFDLSRLLNHGYLPRHYQAEKPRNYLRSYVADYLREEIAAEGLVRNLPIFSRFLDAASLGDTEQSSYASMARDCGVSAHTVRSYYEILEDTLLGAWCHAYRKRPKRRMSTAPKFYFHDVGVVNYLAKRGNLSVGSAQYGKAFENWVFHELYCHNAYQERWEDLCFWRLSTGVEVDFIIGDMELAVEAKATSNVTSDHLKGLRELKRDYAVQYRLLVCLEPSRRLTDDGILIVPAKDWVASLWDGEWLS